MRRVVARDCNSAPSQQWSLGLPDSCHRSRHWFHRAPRSTSTRDEISGARRADLLAKSLQLGVEVPGRHGGEW